MPAQLSLWEEQKPEPVLIPKLGETIEYTNPGWADGDTSQAQLERLARILLQPGLRIEVFPLPKGTYLDNSSNVWFKTVATRIEGTVVIQTLERIAPLITSCTDHVNDNEAEDDLR